MYFPSSRGMTLAQAALFSLSLSCYTNTLNITILQPNVPFVTGKTLTPPFATGDCDEIVELLQNLGRTTVWNLVETIKFEGNTQHTYEPEGMVRIGDDRYFDSAGEYTSPTVSYGNNTIINGTARSAGAGFAHLIVFDRNGSPIADATLTSIEAIEDHTGGIDYDGEYVWAAITQYRPNTTAIIVRIHP